ncbi:MAG: 3-dehydroquinate synthase, partial [Polyangiaceae bacterium]
ALFEKLEATADAAYSGSAQMLAEYIRRAIELKSAVVRDDERELGDRAILNFGHTVGHALEARGNFTRYRHGEAVALGMLAELVIGAELGVTRPELFTRTRDLLGRLGLPTSVTTSELDAAWGFIASDKKRSHGTIRLPLPTTLGSAMVHKIPISSLKAPRLPS